jgi:hypothetical protein
MADRIAPIPTDGFLLGEPKRSVRDLEPLDRYLTGTGQVLTVHGPKSCRGEHCVIHAPSNHNMRNFRTHWREDRGIMERICPHGVGHPDPDGIAVTEGDDGTHGCDGCCAP